MAGAVKTNVGDGRWTSASERLDVVKLNLERRFADAPAFADERALAAIPLPDGDLHGRRDVARIVLHRATLAAAAELLLEQRRLGQAQGLVDGGDGVAADLVGHERLHLVELVEEGLGDDQLDAMQRGRRRRRL